MQSLQEKLEQTKDFLLGVDLVSIRGSMAEHSAVRARTFANPVREQVDHANEMGWDDTIKSNLQRILDRHASSLRKAHKMGVQIIAGSDAGSCGVAHGCGLLNELELMERAGLTSIAVINVATGAPSQRLAFGDEIGQIKPGFLARMILIEHSPLESVCNLKKPRLSIFDGEVWGSPKTDRCTSL